MLSNCWWPKERLADRLLVIPTKAGSIVGSRIHTYRHCTPIQDKQMDTIRLFEDHLIWQYDDHILRIEAWSENSLRVRATKSAQIDTTQDWALLPHTEGAIRFERTENGYCAINGKIRACIDVQGRLAFYNQKGERLLEELWRQRDAGEAFWTLGVHKPKSISALKIDGRDIRPLQGESFELKVRFEADSKERLYGMGQYQQPHLDLKGCTLELAQRNSQASVPFALSNLGYGFLWNNPAVGEATFAKNETRWYAQSSKQIDYWITAGDTPAEILHRYVAATGKPPMMPEELLGLWQCKLRYRTQEELLEVAREYKRRNIDLSVIVVDFFHWTNQGDWRFDPREWPDPKGMCEELAAMGIKLMVSIWPTVDSRTENYKVMREKGYLVHTKKGLDINFDYLGNTKFFDATHPGARQYVWEQAKKNYLDQGVALFWLDEAEPEYGVYDFDNYRYHLGNVLEVGNIYPALYSKTFYDGLRQEGKTDIANLVRCAWAGSQRYGALVWSGDIHSSFDSMRNQLSASLNMAMAGIPWWTMDVGGFHGGNVADPSFHELLIRWFQWGVFTPILRMHGYRDPMIDPEIAYRDGIAQCNTGSGNELWSFGPAVYEVLLAYLRVRECLRPYVLAQMEKAHEDGTPLVRPMFYEFPNQPDCWQVEDQYMFGPDLLIAPVLNEGQNDRSILLPEGVVWVDAFTGEALPGGRSVRRETSLKTIPVFVRQGSPALPMLHGLRAL